MGNQSQAQFRRKGMAIDGVPDGVFETAGAPTSGAGGSYAASARKGSLLVDTGTPKLYMCTAQTTTSGGSSVTWTVVGTQT